ncbi:hypothetical protein OG604_42775 [Streptomyces sp. NBC_01231]|nr:hypothetical protein OG604_42775 [Streptomyces sp. NBC_01231]
MRNNSPIRQWKQTSPLLPRHGAPGGRRNALLLHGTRALHGASPGKGADIP